jgi:hypothetical protein
VVKRPLTRIGYMHPVGASALCPAAIGRALLSSSSRPWAALDASQPPSNTNLLSAQEAEDRLREIVEGFFLGRLRTEDGKRIERLFVKSPPGLGKTWQAIEWAIQYQAEQEGKDGRRLFLGDLNEAGVSAQTVIFTRRLVLSAEFLVEDTGGRGREPAIRASEPRSRRRSPREPGLPTVNRHRAAGRTGRGVRC